MIRVVLPHHLPHSRDRARDPLQIEGPPTQRRILDALEAEYPELRGTIRDPATGRRRDFIRFFACGDDLSHELPDAPIPDAVSSGSEPFQVVGAMAGG